MKTQNQIESLLFISHKPLSISELTKLTGIKTEEVKDILSQLVKEYNERSGGIQILNIKDKFQMASSGDSSEVVSKFIKNEITGELTKPSLEALTIIAYRSPISKAELEMIRGVNCSMILRNLMMRGLIEAQEDKKRGIVLYNVSFDFLKYLGVSKTEDLPDFEKLNKNNNLDNLLQGLDGESENNDLVNNEN